jgi:EmrB/QacA subfamily drug resistance transporter
VADGGAGRGLAAALLTASLMPLNSTMIAVAVPAIAGEFAASPAGVTQAVVASYLVAAIALQSPGGKLGDRLGHWRVFGLGQAVLAGGAVLGTLAPDLVVLALARVLMAVGGAVVVPATLAMLRMQLPPERRGRAYGAFGAVMSLAAAVGPVLGGALVHLFGWRSTFVVNLPVLVVSVLLVARPAPRDTSHRAPARFDWRGSLLLTVALVGLVAAAQLSGAAAATSAILGGAALVPFVWWERRVADPVIAFRLFRSPVFTAGSALVALLNLVMYSVLFDVPLLAHRLFRLGAEQVGTMLAFLTAAMVVASFVAGRLTDRFGCRTLALAGTLSCAAAILVLRQSHLDRPGDLHLPLLLLGLGVGIANPAAQTASLSGVAASVSGMAAGISSTMRYLGGVAGVALLGAVVDFHGSRATVLAGHRTVHLVFLGALAAGVACALVLPGARDNRLSGPGETKPAPERTMEDVHNMPGDRRSRPRGEK